MWLPAGCLRLLDNFSLRPALIFTRGHLPGTSYNLAQTVTLKSNGFLLVNFTVP